MAQKGCTVGAGLCPPEVLARAAGRLPPGCACPGTSSLWPGLVPGVPRGDVGSSLQWLRCNR